MPFAVTKPSRGAAAEAGCALTPAAARSSITATSAARKPDVIKGVALARPKGRALLAGCLIAAPPGRGIDGEHHVDDRIQERRADADGDTSPDIDSSAQRDGQHREEYQADDDVLRIPGHCHGEVPLC